MFRTPHSLLRVLAIAEAVSWTLLISGLILRATLDLPIAVTIGGGIHGFVFLCYGATVVLVSLNSRWKAGPTVAMLASAVVPYATIPAEIWATRRGLLAGQWLIHEDRPPARWYDDVLGWFLRRPWVLFGSLAALIVLAYVVLLLVGPPGGRS